MVSEDGLWKNQVYFEKVKRCNIDNIKCIMDLHSFLGLVVWQRKFVKRAAEIAKPLMELISKPRKSPMGEIKSSFLNSLQN